MIRLRLGLRRKGHRSLAAMAVALIALVVIWAHSGPGGHHMPDHEMDQVAAVCLAVLEGGGLLLLGFGLAGLVRRPRPTLAARPPAPLFVPAPSRPKPIRSRAGPATLQVFLR